MGKERLQRGLYRLVIVVSIIVALVAAAYAGTITRTPAEAQNVAIYTALASLTFGGLVYGIGRLLLWAGKDFAQD
jgi:hypothetical protein